MITCYDGKKNLMSFIVSGLLVMFEFLREKPNVSPQLVNGSMHKNGNFKLAQAG